MTEGVTVLAALIGAIVGSLGAVWLTGRQARSAEVEVRRRALVNRHLFQLQDAAETLWHRLENLRRRSGRSVMTDDYFAQTTLYALGHVLAVERILGLEGVYPELASLEPDLSEFLKTNRVDAALEDIQLFKYDRLTLAETVIEREDGRFRAGMYVEFRRRYENPDLAERAWLTPARNSLAALDNKAIDALMARLAEIVRRLEPITQLPSSIERSTPLSQGVTFPGAASEPAPQPEEN